MAYSIIDAGDSSLGTLKNPYEGATSFLHQWGQDRDKQKELDLQHQRQAVLDGYAKAQEGRNAAQGVRQEEAAARQATVADQQSTLFKRDTDIYNRKQDQSSFDKAYNAAAVYYREHPNDPGAKDAFINTKVNASPDVINAEQSHWDDHLVTMRKLVGQNKADRNSDAQYQIIQSKLKTAKDTNTMNADLLNAPTQMMARSQELTNDFSGNGMQYINSLPQEAQSLFKKGSNDEGYKSLTPVERIRFNNLMNDVGDKATLLGDTYAQRLTELDPSNPTNKLNWLNRDGDYTDNSAYANGMATLDVKTYADRQKQIATTRASMQKLQMKLGVGSDKEQKAYTTALNQYDKGTNSVISTVTGSLSKALKNSGEKSSLIAAYASKGYSAAQIGQLIKNKNSKVGKPARTIPKRSNAVASADTSRNAELSTLKDTLNALQHPHAPVGKVNLQQRAVDIFGNTALHGKAKEVTTKIVKDVAGVGKKELPIPKKVNPLVYKLNTLVAHRNDHGRSSRKAGSLVDIKRLLSTDKINKLLNNSQKNNLSVDSVQYLKRLIADKAEKIKRDKRGIEFQKRKNAPLFN